MAAYISEDQQSRSIDMNNGGGSSTRKYTMRDYTEADDAYRALRDYAPSYINIYGFELTRTGVKVTPDFSDPQATLYRGEVSYKSETMEGSTPNKTSGGGGGGDDDLPKNRPVGKGQDPKKEKIDPDETSKVWFTFGTMSRTITQNLGDRRMAKGEGGNFESKTDSFKWINKDADDVAPAGVQVEDGTMFMHLQVVLTRSQLTPDFYRASRSALMSVNRNPFAYSFEPGTVQFQGIDIEEMVKGDFKVVYHFEYRPLLLLKRFTTDLNGQTEILTGLRNGKDDLSFTGFDYTWLSWQDVTTKEEPVEGETITTYSRAVDSINLAQVYPRVAFKTDGCLKHCKKPEGEKAKWRL